MPTAAASTPSAGTTDAPSGWFALTRASRLIIGIGNPSRGDDALGPLTIERLEDLNLPNVELLTDFQLQVEYLLDMEARKEVVFIDASVSDEEAFQFTPITALADQSFSSHALTPSAVLWAYERHYGKAAPPAYVLAIRGYEFELGEELSKRAALNLEAALAFLAGRLSLP
jgi:hydrogenase maturation protease